MAKSPKKAPVSAINAKKATRAAKEQATLARKQARLAKHLKKHPNDKQSAHGFKGTPRKKPYQKGSAPQPVYVFRDDSGKPEAKQPRFKGLYVAD